MKLLLELRDKDIGAISKKSIMKERAASRAILMNNGKIALMNVTKHSYHKLPGGGIEKGESIEEALLREMKEETGCKIKIIAELGKIIEHRTHLGIIQTSYCYLAEVVKKGKPEFDKGELSAGYKLEWVKIDEAIKLLKKEPETKKRLENYAGKFIIKRELKFIEEARKIINSQLRRNPMTKANIRSMLCTKHFRFVSLN
ncbi:MAG TPA: NUDIX domain-containing protein [Candidatus Aenigmarchaeota archaeon]|nr:NUDIX domain-containing protein [Candidatus Aenigmarchaeota archaeon]